MDDKTAVVIIAMVMVMSGFNSVVLLIATGDTANAPEDIAISVDVPAQEPYIIVPAVNPVTNGKDTKPANDTNPNNPVKTETTKIQKINNVIDTLNRAPHKLSPLFKRNTYIVVGDIAKSTDVLGSAILAYALAAQGTIEEPEGRTEKILTEEEHDSGNLIIVGGPAVNPVATEFGKLFRISYEHNINESFKINTEAKSIYLDLRDYPHEDICLIYVREYKGQNILMVWGYGWQGTYAGSLFAADPETWKVYNGARMIMIRWIDENENGLIEKAEIQVESHV
jgi:hypothetical protein